MKVTRHLHAFSESLPNVKWYHLAWQHGSEVHFRRPFHRVFYALERHAHELGHVPRAKRPTGLSHTPWYQFGTMSPLALRLRRDVPESYFEEARVLMESGEVEVQ